MTRFMMLIVALSLVVGAPARAAAGQPVPGVEPVTLDDIIVLAQGGLSDETIIAFLDSRPLGFVPSAEDIIRLRQAGVSERVIQYLLRRVAAGRASLIAGDLGAAPPAGPLTPTGTVFSSGVVLFPQPFFLHPHGHAFHHHHPGVDERDDGLTDRGVGSLASTRRQRRVEAILGSSRFGLRGGNDHPVFTPGHHEHHHHAGLFIPLAGAGVGLSRSAIALPSISFSSSGLAQTAASAGAAGATGGAISAAQPAGSTTGRASQASRGVSSRGVGGTSSSTGRGTTSGRAAGPRHAPAGAELSLSLTTCRLPCPAFRPVGW